MAEPLAELLPDSDISDADSEALLASLMDLDSMDAAIFGSRKTKSAPAKDSRINQYTDPLPKAQEKRTSPRTARNSAVKNEKPQTAPAGSAKPYKKFSFDDPNDPLGDLLFDEDGSLPKMTKATNAKLEPTLSKSELVSVKTNDSPVISPVRSLPASQKKNDVNFEEDVDDIMDVLGFEGQHTSQKENRPARSKLDELLGRGTSAKLLERPPTGEKKEIKLDLKYQKMSEKEDLLNDEDFAFGSYQPTMAINLEGLPSRSSSIRFSEDGKENLKSNATPAVHGPVHGAKSGADWLGLTDEDIPDLSPSVPLKEISRLSGVTPSSAGPPASGTKTEIRTTPLPRTSQTTPQLKGKHTTPQPRENDIATQPKDAPAETPALPEENDKWLISALARKKTQKQEETGEHNGQKDISAMGNPASSVNTAQKSGLNNVASEAMHAATEISQTPLPWENPRKVSTSASPTNRRQKGILETGLSEPTESHKVPFEPVTSLSKAPENGKYSEREMSELQNRVLDLEAQIRKLQQEKERQNLLLEALQQRHKEDLELIEHAQRNRLKLLESSAHQKEDRLCQENQALSAQYLARIQSVEQEKSELFSKYQRKLTEFQQEKDKEVQRIRELQRLSVQEMCKDHEEQLQRVKCLKDQEIDAVTSASSKTRSLNGVIEQMESFSHKLSDLSVRVESSHMNTSQEIQLGARQREGQLIALQERLTQHQKDMEEERNSLHIIISNMEVRLSEQNSLLEQERWKVSAKQAKMESLQRSLEEQKRVMTQQMAIEREELEKAKSVLLGEQQSVMTHCTEERKKLAAEWAELHTQQKLSKERAESDINRVKMAESQREGVLLSLAKEQTELKVQATELRNKEEQLAAASVALEKERHELRQEKDRVHATAMHVQQRAEEIESMSKMALQCREEGEKALVEAKKVEYGHQDRLRSIQQQLERLKQQETHLLQGHRNVAHLTRQLNQLSQGLPTAQALTSKPDVHQTILLSESLHLDGAPVNEAKIRLTSSEPLQDKAHQTSDIYAKLALLKLSAQQDRDFLEDEQLFLDALKRSNIACSQNV